MILSPEQINSLIALLCGLFTLGVYVYKEVQKESEPSKKDKVDDSECKNLLRHLSQIIREQHQELTTLKEANELLAMEKTNNAIRRQYH